MEILEADDADLNEYYSLKKLAPFRRKDLVERDREKFKKYKKKKLKEFRQKLQEKKASEGVKAEMEVKRDGAGKKRKRDGDVKVENVKAEADVKVEGGDSEKKKKKKKQKVENGGDTDVKMEDGESTQCLPLLTMSCAKPSRRFSRQARTRRLQTGLHRSPAGARHGSLSKSEET